MHYKLAILLFFIVSRLGLATTQFPDLLIYKGDTLPMYTFPLEYYFDSHNRPDSVIESYNFVSTACWRGYIGLWEIKNDSLFLISLLTDSQDIDLSLLSNDWRSDSEIYCDWFSDKVYCPFGDLLNYGLAGWDAIYEYEWEFTIQNGRLINSRHLDNTRTKISKYTQDTRLIHEHIQENFNFDSLPEFKKSGKVFVEIIRADSLGRIDSVRVVRGIDPIIDNEVIRVVKLIPQWDILYLHGEQFQMTWTIPVFFEKSRKKNVRPANKM